MSLVARLLVFVNDLLRQMHSLQHRSRLTQRVLTDSSKLELSIPRDRHGRFDPQLIAKYQRRFPGFDQKVVALYARGMSTREIRRMFANCTGL